MYCSKCGNKLEDSDCFCPACGAAVKKRNEAIDDTVPMIQFEDEDIAQAPEIVGDSRQKDSASDSYYSDNYQGPVIKKVERRHKEGQNSSRERSPLAKPSARKTDEKKRRNSKKQKNVIIVCSVFIILAVVAAAALAGLTVYKNYSLSGLKDACASYEQAMTEYAVEDTKYTELLERARTAVDKEDFSAAGDLKKELKEAEEVIETTYSAKKKLTELKNEYTDIFARYRISGDYKETYDNVMKSLDEAIASSNEKAYNSLKKELESLKINLNTSNQQEVTNLKNEITAVDVSEASDSDKAVLEDYEKQVNEAIAVNDYAKALDVLELWKTEVQRVEKEIAEENKAKEESMEAERQKMEEEDKKAQEQQSANQSDYILPQSSTQILTEADLSGLSAQQLLLARNEIYARHGRKFKDAQIQEYFDSKSWYNGTVEAENFDPAVLSDIERTNISFIKAHEA